MRYLLSLALAFGVAMAAESPSALETQPKGWKDLTPRNEKLSGWKRLPDAKDPQLAAVSPWRLDRARKVLVCDGAKAGHEYLQFTGREYGDFILHVEWRFLPVEGNPRYNSGVLFRTSADNKVWHQAQTGPSGGFLFGMVPVGGELQRVMTNKEMKENRVKPAGEWNVYEITARGPDVSLWVNGAVTSEMKTEAPKGFLSLEAEGFAIEFRNMRIKELAPGN